MPTSINGREPPTLRNVGLVADPVDSRALDGRSSVAAGELPRSSQDGRKIREDLPVAPGPPANSVSPLKSEAQVGDREVDEPGEWPGV